MREQNPGSPDQRPSRRSILAAGAGAAAAVATQPGGTAWASPGAGSSDPPGRTGAGRWVGTWAAAPTEVPATGIVVMLDQTLRQVVHASAGGDAVRVRLTNEFGDQPLVIGEAHVALLAAGAGTDVLPHTDRTLTFGGAPAVTLPAGAPMISDPVTLRVPAGADLVVSLYLPGSSPVTTMHGSSFQENAVVAGNATGAATIGNVSTITQWRFLSGVSVWTTRRAAASVVAFGDSITDGFQTETNANHRWPDLFAQRLRAASGMPVRGVVNLGIPGNRLLHDPNPPAGSEAEAFAATFGHSALRRFDRDVLAQPGARFVIVLLGVNDLGHPGTVAPQSEVVTATEMIGAHRQLIVRAHAAGMRVFGGTILPFKDDSLGFYSETNERKRQAVNQWIRSGGEYDGVVDFDAATRDPAEPRRLRAQFDSGDGLHPNDAGMAAMAAAVPLRFFR